MCGAIAKLSVENHVARAVLILTLEMFCQLHEELMPIASKGSLLEALLSLERRSLIEKASHTLIENNSTRFSVPPIFKEYMGVVFQTEIL